MANLVVEISARATNLSRGLAKAKSSVSKFAKDAAKTMAKIGLAMVAAFTASTAIVINSINKTAASIDKLAKTSSKLGVAVIELQKLRFAAELAGVGANTLDTALQRMVRRVAEAAKGTGEAKNALKELGVDAKELAALSPDQQFRRIGEAMQGISSQGEKVRLAFKIFDTEGVGILNVFNSELSKSDGLFKRLELGLTSSQAKAVESFNDSKTVLAAIFQSFKEQVTSVVAPAFEAIIKHVTDTIEKMGGMRSVAISFGKGIIAAAKGGISALQFMHNTLEGISIVMDVIVLGTNRFVLTLIKAADLLKGVGKAIKEAGAAFGKTSISKPGFGFGEAAFEISQISIDTAPSDRFKDIELGIREQEEAIAERIKNFGKSTFISELEALSTTLDGIEQKATTANVLKPGTSGTQGRTSAKTVTLKDVQNMMRNQNKAPDVNIRVDAKTRQLFDFVVENPSFTEKINSRVDSRTENARRRITR